MEEQPKYSAFPAGLLQPIQYTVHTENIQLLFQRAMRENVVHACHFAESILAMWSTTPLVFHSLVVGCADIHISRASCITHMTSLIPAVLNIAP